jgi:hypothetical protein
MVEKLWRISDTSREEARAFTLTFLPKSFILGLMKLGFTNEIKGFSTPALHGRRVLLSANARDLNRNRLTIMALFVLPRNIIPEQGQTT